MTHPTPTLDRCAVNPRHTLRDDEHTTCYACIARTRTLILEINEGATLLPDAIATLTATRYDHGTTTRAADDTPVPGGDALVLLAGGTTGNVTWTHPCTTPRCTHTHPGCPISHFRDQHPTDPPSITAVLEGIETDWRRHLHHTLNTTGQDTTTYLLTHLTQAAATYPEFPTNHTDLQALHARVTTVTGTTDTPEILAAPCPHCGGRITRPWTENGLGTRLECDGCGMRWDHAWYLPESRRQGLPDGYALAQRQAIEDLPWARPGALVTLDQAKIALRPHGVRGNLLDVWRHRGTISPVVREDGQDARDERGRRLYRLGDLAARAGVLVDGARLDDLLARVAGSAP